MLLLSLGIFCGIILAGETSPVSNPPCRSKICDDRPECPQSSCRCLYPSKLNCDVYYQCVKGKPIQYKCSPGLLFNAETLSCDYEDNVNCTYGRTTESFSSSTADITRSTARISTLSSTPSPTADETTTTPDDSNTSDASTFTSSDEQLSTDITTIGTTASQSPTTDEFTTQDNEETSTFQSTSISEKSSSSTPSSIMSTETPKEIIITSSEEPNETTSEDHHHYSTSSERISTAGTDLTTLKQTSSDELSTSPTYEEGTTSANDVIITTTLNPKTNATTTEITDRTRQDTTLTSEEDIKTVLTTNTETVSTTDSVTTTSSDTRKPVSSTKNSSETTDAITIVTDPTSDIIITVPTDAPSIVTVSTSDNISTSHTDVTSIVKDPTSDIIITVPTDAASIVTDPTSDNISTSHTDVTSIVTDPTSDIIFTVPTDAASIVTVSISDNISTSHTGVTSIVTDPTSEIIITGPTDAASIVTDPTSEKSTTSNTADITNPTSRFTITDQTTIITSEPTTEVSRSTTTEDNRTNESSTYSDKPTAVTELPTQKTSATKISTTFEGSSTTSTNDDVTKFECPSRFGLYPDAENCSSFYQCSHWTAYHKKCPSDLHFNPSLTVCDWSEKAGCRSQLSTPNEHLATSTPSDQKNITYCDCDSCDLPVPNDCRSYLLCIEGAATLITCGDGLYYNPKSGTCDFEDHVQCETVTCPGPNGRFPYPNSCSHYMECESQVIVTVKKCPEEMSFDAKVLNCSWSDSCNDPETSSETSVEPKKTTSIENPTTSSEVIISTRQKPTTDLSTESPQNTEPFTETSRKATSQKSTTIDSLGTITTLSSSEDEDHVTDTFTKTTSKPNQTTGSSTEDRDSDIEVTTRTPSVPDETTNYPTKDGDSVTDATSRTPSVPDGTVNSTEDGDSDTEVTTRTPSVPDGTTVTSTEDGYNDTKFSTVTPSVPDATTNSPTEDGDSDTEVTTRIPSVPDGTTVTSTEDGDSDTEVTTRTPSVPDGTTVTSTEDGDSDTEVTTRIPSVSDGTTVTSTEDGDSDTEVTTRIPILPDGTTVTSTEDGDSNTEVTTRIPSVPDGTTVTSTEDGDSDTEVTTRIPSVPDGTTINSTEDGDSDTEVTTRIPSVPDGTTVTSTEDGDSDTEVTTRIPSVPDGTTVTSTEDGDSDTEVTTRIPSVPDGTTVTSTEDGNNDTEFTTRTPSVPDTTTNSHTTGSKENRISTPTTDAPFPSSTTSSHPITTDEEDPDPTEATTEVIPTSVSSSTATSSTSKSTEDTTISRTTLKESSSTAGGNETSGDPLTFECPSRFGLYPDPESCFRFYHCSHWEPHHKWCPSDLHFNPVLQVCDWPYRAGCGDETPPHTSTTAEEDSSQPTSPCECECCFTPDETDCSKYFLCLDGERHEGRCADGLLFDTLNGNCDLAGRVNCSSRCTDGEVVASPENCSSFYRCVDGRPSLQRCPGGQHFGGSRKSCVEPCEAKCDETLDCPDFKSSTPKSEICIEEEAFYRSGDCSSFYQCVEGQAYLVQCPDGLHFNIEYGVCEHPCDAQCDTTIDCNHHRSARSLTCPTPNGLFPVPHDCGSFYMCSNGVEHKIHCPPGLDFSGTSETCEEPCKAGCNRTLLACKSPNVTSSNLNPDRFALSSNCKAPNGTFANPKDCESYFQCNNGVEKLVKCPDGLHYSTEDNICENPCIANCDNDIDDCPTEIPDDKGNCTCSDCYLPDPTDCSAFYFCSHRRGHLTKGYCPFGTLFDRREGRCSRAEESVVCDTVADPALCSSGPYGFDPYPGDCEKFVHCVDSVAFVRKCEKGLEFDPVVKACANPNGRCGKESIDSNCLTPTGTFPHPENSSLFYHCENGAAYLKECPFLLTYNRIDEVCDWPAEEASNEGHIIQRSERKNECNEIPGVICPCACRVTTYDECNSFYHCRQDGTACKKFCPEGLYFNKQKMVCDLPHNVECRDFFFTAMKQLRSWI